MAAYEIDNVPRMANQTNGSRRWPLFQFGYGIAAFVAAVLALAMTLPTPPLFDVEFISAVRPSLLVAAPVLGVVAALLIPWTIRSPGRWRWLAIVSTILAAGGFGLGLAVVGILARAG